MARKFHARPVPTVLIVAGLCLLCYLCAWQTGRYYEKLERERVLRDFAHEPPIAITSLEQLEDDALAYRMLSVEGRVDTRYNILLRHRQYEGRPGFWLLSPLVLPDGKSAVLVNRGWLPVKDGADLANTLPAPQETHYHGILFIPEQILPDEPTRAKLGLDALEPNAPPLQWRTMDLDAISGALPYLFPSTARVLTLDTRHSGSPLPVASTAHVTAPYMTSDRHLGYAAFWGTCALALAGLGLAAGFRVLR